MVAWHPRCAGRVKRNLISARFRFIGSDTTPAIMKPSIHMIARMRCNSSRKASIFTGPSIVLPMLFSMLVNRDWLIGLRVSFSQLKAAILVHPQRIAVTIGWIRIPIFNESVCPFNRDSSLRIKAFLACHDGQLPFGEFQLLTFAEFRLEIIVCDMLRSHL